MTEIDYYLQYENSKLKNGDFYYFKKFPKKSVHPQNLAQSCLNYTKAIFIS